MERRNVRSLAFLLGTTAFTSGVAPFHSALATPPYAWHQQPPVERLAPLETPEQVKPNELIRPEQPPATSAALAPLNPYLNNTLHVITHGEVYRDSTIEIVFYPYQYPDRKYQADVSLEGIHVDTVYPGKADSITELISGKNVRLSFYFDKPEISVLPEKDFWKLNIELYREGNDENCFWPVEKREILVDPRNYNQTGRSKKSNK